MNNHEIADIFLETAELLELKGGNPFKIRAYRTAAQNISSLGEDVAEIAKRNELQEIPGIGKDLAERVQEFLEKRKITAFDKLKKEVPKVMLDFVKIPGVGPKTAKVLYKKRHIKSISQLKRMAEKHKLRGLPGLKAKTEENILKGIEFLKKSSGRHQLDLAMNVAQEIIENLSKLKEVHKVDYAGSLRRMKDTVRDIDILITSYRPSRVMKYFTTLPAVKQVVAKGMTKSTVITAAGLQVDLRIVEPDKYGAALVYFTGSKAHNIRLRNLAKKSGKKLSEYGIFKGKKNLASKHEEDLYKVLGLPYIEPELREDRGEIDAGLKHKLPKLINLKNIKGDLHVHTESSDGHHSIHEIANACKKRGYKYVVISDHSKTLKVAGGLTEKELCANIKKVRGLNKKIKGLKIFMGSEVDILNDGSLDYKDSLLKELDFVIAAIHSGFKQGKEKLTKRILKAMDNRYVNMIAHLSGRLLGERQAYELDYEKILKKAKETSTALEINSHPKRLDMTDVYVKRAKEIGVKIGISTDMHYLNELDNMKYGVSVARRGWCEKKDVLNTLSAKDFKKAISAKK